MKPKNLKYFMTSMLLALNISLVGCAPAEDVSIEPIGIGTTDAFDEQAIEMTELDKIVSKTLGEEKKEQPFLGIPIIEETGTESIEEMDSLEKIVQESLNPEEETSSEDVSDGIEEAKEFEEKQDFEENPQLAELKKLAAVNEIYITGNGIDNGYEIQFTSQDESLSYTIKEGVEETRDFLDTLIFTDESSVNFINCEDLEIIKTISHPENIKSLSIKNCPMENVSFLEDYKNLQNLRIQNCPNLENIEALKHLTKLKGISMLDTNVSDIRPLSNLKDVVLLDLRCNQIEDVSPLQELLKLQYIHLEYNRIMDAESLRFLEERGLISEYERYLIPATLWKNNLSITCEKYKNQTQFHQLRIQKLKSKEDFIDDGYFIEVYDEQGNLCEYALENKNDDSYHFKNTYNSITLSSVEDLSVLEKIQNKEAITSIHLSSCSIQSLEGIQLFPNVHDISIINCDSLSDISTLSEIPNVYCLIIKNTPIADISSLSSLEDLELLWLSCTYVEDLDPILELPKLREGYFLCNTRTDIADINALQEKGVYVQFSILNGRSKNDNVTKGYTK